MTDETLTPSTPEEPGVTLLQVWGAYYEAVLAYLTGNGLNKADRQQYRLKAADIAVALTSLTVR